MLVRISLSCLLFGCCQYALLGQDTAEVAVSADAKVVDPSGTWKWEVDFGGNKIDNALRIEAKEGKLSGTLQSIFENAPPDAPAEMSAPVKIDEGKIEGDKISYSVTRSFNGNEFTVTYAGVVSGEEIEGTTAMNFGGEEREFPWSAKRTLTIEDVAGDWMVKFRIPEGEVEESLTLVKGEGDQKPTGTYRSSHFGDTAIKDIKINDDKLSFVLELSNDDMSVTASFNVKPRGDKLEGTIFAEVGEEEMEMPVTGKRVKKPAETAK